MQRKIRKQDRKFVKANSISQCLRCSVCFEPFHEPTRLFCGHSFCWQCVQSWSKSQSNCPICRTKINSANVGKDLLAFNIINQLTVFCCHNDCPWKGPLQNFQMHVNHECIFDEIQREAKANNQVKSNKAPAIQNLDEEVQEKINENISKGNLISRVMMKNNNKFGKAFDVARKIIRAQSHKQKFGCYSQSKAKVGKKKGKQQQQIRIKSPHKSQSPLGDLDFLMQLYQSK